jgi:hypothetical protein
MENKGACSKAKATAQPTLKLPALVWAPCLKMGLLQSCGEDDMRQGKGLADSSEFMPGG